MLFDENFKTSFEIERRDYFIRTRMKFSELTFTVVK